MGVSSWLYTNSKRKNTVVKIVHPGGHAELHDRPIIAADIIRRNPRCCVAHPNVFHQPWAIVPPNTTLMPGQKFYVVPIATIRKLQKLSLKYHPSLAQEIQSSQNSQVEDVVYKTNVVKKDTEVKDLKNYRCFKCLIRGFKTKASNEDSSMELRSSSSFESSVALAKKRTLDGFSRKRGSPTRHASLDNWEPNLESINEEFGEDKHAIILK